MNLDPSTKPEIRVERICSVADLQRSRDEMLALWREDDAATVFQSPHWLFTWLERVNPREQLSVLIIRSGELMIGYAPFCLRRTREALLELSFIPCGISDYLDVIIRSEYQLAAINAIFAYLAAWSGWDMLKLEELRAHSPMLRHPIAFENEIETQSVCPVLTLSPLSQLSEVLPTPAFGRLSYYRRRLARNVPISIEFADETNVDSMLDSFVALHHRRWTARGESGVLADAGIIAFHRSVAKALLGEGMLRLSLLKLDGRDAAALYGFHRGGRAMYYLGGFAPEFARFNPGTILVGNAIEMAAAEGAKEFDFLRGSEPYKFFWGARPRLNYRRIIRRGHDIPWTFQHVTNPGS